MKLAEALNRRKELVAEISRDTNVLSQEWTIDSRQKEDFDEKAARLQNLKASLFVKHRELRILVERINKTNIMNTITHNGQTLSIMGAIVLRDSLDHQGINLQQLEGVALERKVATVDDIKYIPLISAKEIREERNRLAKERRELDSTIQQANWTVDLA